MKKKIAFTLAVLGIAVLGTLTVNIIQTKKAIGQKVATASEQTQLPVFTAALLAPFDGTRTDQPIYIALDGYVYDVTVGREFYQVGGSYHYLAGRDASADLHLFGGDIIKKKYPIIGVFADADQTAPQNLPDTALTI